MRLGWATVAAELLPRPIVAIFEHFLVVEPVETLASSFLCSQAESPSAPAASTPAKCAEADANRRRSLAKHLVEANGDRRLQLK